LYEANIRKNPPFGWGNNLTKVNLSISRENKNPRLRVKNNLTKIYNEQQIRRPFTLKSKMGSKLAASGFN
jgi:hypothetical protein